MKENKKANLRPHPLGIFGVIVLLALVSSSGPYAPSFGVQYQQQQFPTIIVASSIQNMTTEASGLNATTKIANETATITTPTAAPDVTLVEFVSSIEQIRGHLEQALINKESGNNTLAQTHSLHPIEEVYSSIEDQLVNQNSTLNQTLSGALQNLSSTVTNATIIEVVEYQDAQAFIHRAESIFKSSVSRMNQTLADEVEEVNEFFSNLNGAVNNRDDHETVETTINGIIHELAEITGLSESQLIGEEAGAEEQDHIAIINNIKSLLNQLIAAYESQDYQGAESIATEAYLDNYEYIEIPLAQRDQQLMEQTEIMLREELRQMITDRVPIEQIEQHVTMINANLDRAAELLQ